MISVIVPVYNRKKLLERCLKSLSNQTFKNFECIVCDDGSKEDFTQIIDFYKTKIDLKYLKIKNSGGPARPRNFGIKKSKYDYISFLDSDDEWFPNRLESCYKFLIEGIEFLHHDSLIISGNKKQKSKGFNLCPNYIDNLLLKGNPIITSNTIVKKNLLFKSGFFNENSIYHSIEDLDLWIKIFLKNKSIKYMYLKKTLGNYYIYNDSISKNNLSKHIRRHFVLYKSYNYLFKNRSKEYLSSLYYMSLSMSFNNNDFYLAKFYIKKFFLKKVFDFRVFKIFFKFFKFFFKKMIF